MDVLLTFLPFHLVLGTPHIHGEFNLLQEKVEVSFLKLE